MIPWVYSHAGISLDLRAVSKTRRNQKPFYFCDKIVLFASIFEWCAACSHLNYLPLTKVRLIFKNFFCHFALLIKVPSTLLRKMIYFFLSTLPFWSVLFSIISPSAEHSDTCIARKGTMKIITWPFNVSILEKFGLQPSILQNLE